MPATLTSLHGLPFKLSTSSRSCETHLGLRAFGPARLLAPLRLASNCHHAANLRPSCSYQRGRDYSTQRRRRPRDLREVTPELVSRYALPGLGLLAAATLVGPIIGAMVLSAVGFGIAAMAAATALSLSWVFIPGFLFFIGLPALVYGGITAGLFAGAASLLLMPTLLMAGGLWLGVRLAKNLFFVEEGEEQPSYGTVDIDAETVAKFDEEMREAEGRRAQELREFDEMLRRRERLKREGGY